MQKVERQKHKDRKRRRLTGVILCTLLLAICITAGLLLRQKAEKTWTIKAGGFLFRIPIWISKSYESFVTSWRNLVLIH